MVENPYQSELFKLPEMWKLKRDFNVGDVSFPQCAVGLTNPEGTLPILKWTTLWSNSPDVLEEFRGLTCTCKEHSKMVGTYGGYNRSQLAQIWPMEMCHKIVNGVARTISRLGRPTSMTY